MSKRKFKLRFPFAVDNDLHGGTTNEQNTPIKISYQSAQGSLAFKMVSTNAAQRQLYAMVHSSMYIHPKDGNTIIFAVNPLFEGAQYAMGLNGNQTTSYISYHFPKGLNSVQKKQLFDKAFFNNTKLFDKYYQRRKSFNINSNDRNAVKDIFYQRFLNQSFSLPVQGGQKLIELAAKTEMHCSFLHAEYKPQQQLPTKAFTIDPHVLNQLLELLAADSHYDFILQSYFYGELEKLKKTGPDLINLEIVGGKMDASSNMTLMLTAANPAQIYDLKKVGDVYECSGSTSSWPPNFQDFPGAGVIIPSIKFKVKDLPKLEDLDTANLGLTIYRTSKLSYFVPGIISKFWNPLKKIEYRLRLYQGINMQDANPNVAGDQAQRVHLVPSRFYEGKISLYVNDGQLGFVKTDVIKGLSLDINTSTGLKKCELVKDKKGTSFHYKIYRTDAAKKVKLRTLGSSGIPPDLSAIARFNNKGILLKDFLKQREHKFFLDRIPILLKPIFLFNDAAKGQRQVLISSIMATAKVSNGHGGFFFQDLGNSGSAIDLSKFIALDIERAGYLAIKFLPKAKDEESVALLSLFYAIVDGKKHLEELKDAFRLGNLSKGPVVNRIITKSFTPYHKRIQFNILTSSGKTLEAKHIEVNIQILGKNHVVKAKTSQKGALDLLRSKPVDLSALVFVFPVQKFNNIQIPAQVIKGKDLLKGKNTLKAANVALDLNLHLQFFYQQKTPKPALPISTISAELWGEELRGSKTKKKLLATATTDEKGLCIFKLERNTRVYASYGRIYPVLKTNDKSVGPIANYPGNWSARGIFTVDKKAIVLQLSEIMSGLIGTASKPLRFHLNTSFTVKVGFDDGHAYVRPTPPGIYFNLVGEQSGKIYGTGISQLDGLLEYELFNPSVSERVFLRAGDHTSKEHTAVFNSPKAHYSLQSVSFKTLGSIRTKAIQLLGGKGRSFDLFDFVVRDQRQNPHVLFAIKCIYEVHTWIGIMTQKNNKAWTKTDGLVVKSHQEKTDQGRTEMRISTKNTWNRNAYAHEFAHYIQYHTIDVNSTVIDPHVSPLITNPKSAFTEGWAAFIEELFTDVFSPEFDKYRRDTKPEKFRVQTKYKKGVEFVLDPSHKPRHKKNTTNLGESVEGAVAMLMFAAMELVIFRSGSPRLNKAWPTLDNHGQTDIKKHPAFSDPKKYSAHKYLDDTIAISHFNRLIWTPFLESKGSSTTFAKKLLANAYTDEKPHLLAVMKRLNIQQS